MNASRTLFTTTVTGFAQDRALRKRQEKTFTDRSADASRDSLKEEMRNYTRDALRVQRSLGLDVPDAARSDYPDEIGAMALALAGFQLDLTAGGMSRHTITNTYISKPSISSEAKFQETIAPEYDENNKRFKVSIPGIYTVAARTMKPDSKDFDRLLEGLAPAYDDVLKSLETPYVQFNEYELLKNATSDNIERVKSVYDRVSFRGKKIVAFYFGDIRPVVEHLDDFPVDIVHLDVYYGKNSAHLLEHLPRRKEIVLGLLDSVQYRGDDEDGAIRFAKQVAEKVDPSNLWLSTNGDLVYRGRSFAESKIEALVRIASTLRR